MILAVSPRVAADYGDRIREVAPGIDLVSPTADGGWSGDPERTEAAYFSEDFWTEGRYRATLPQLFTLPKLRWFHTFSAGENGRKRKVPAIEALLLRLLNKSLEGDLRAFDKLLKQLPMLQAAMAADEAVEGGEAVDPETDAEALAEFTRMIRDTEIDNDNDMRSASGSRSGPTWCPRR